MTFFVVEHADCLLCIPVFFAFAIFREESGTVRIDIKPTLLDLSGSAIDGYFSGDIIDIDELR